MFERNIEETIAHFRRETIADASQITSREILSSSMPPALKRMFEADIDALLQGERERLLRSDHFRYDDEEILALFERIAERAREQAVFTTAEYDSALEKNVKLLFNHACRPQWTLVKYLFADREHASTADILSALGVFWYHEYYQVILRHYFEQKSISVMHVKKFTELIERIDHEVVRSFDSRKTAHLTEPIFELFNIGSTAETLLAPVEALSIFFDDKNLGSIVERLDREKSIHERLTMHDLVVLIGDADFTLGMEISNIVSAQLHQKGAMQPERKVTAGEDFGIPEMPEFEQKGLHHGDLGHEHDTLDFIITEEEQGVIMQEHDHIHTHLGNDLSDDVEIGEITLDEEESGEMDLAENPESSAGPDTDEPETTEEEAFGFGAELDQLRQDAEDDDAVSDFTAESILHLEQELESSPLMSPPAPDLENPPLTGVDDLPDLMLEDESDRPTRQYLETKDVIPDISLDEIEAIELSLDSEEMDTDPYSTTPLSLHLSDEDSVQTGVETASETALSFGATDEEDIDWDKEAEDLEDLDLDSVESAEEKLTDTLPPESPPFGRQEELQPAEELLRQLDLDEVDHEVQPSRRRLDEIPVFDDAPEPISSRPAPLAEVEAEDDLPAATEEVIREFGDLRQLLPDADKKKYIRKLFQKNEEAFTHALQVLNGKRSWRQASEYIDELFIKFDVDMYSRLAVKFTDDIYKRYANNKK